MSILCIYVDIGDYLFHNVSAFLEDSVNIKTLNILKSLYLTMRYLYVCIFRLTPSFFLRAHCPSLREACVSSYRLLHCLLIGFPASLWLHCHHFSPYSAEQLF